MVKLIPAMNGLRFCACPNCNRGTQEGQMEWNGVSDPDHVHCRYCQMVFPNAKYPENKTLDAINRHGEKEIWRFYEDAAGIKYFFSARSRYEAKQFMAARTYDFAASYALTGKQEYARRAALLLNRYAEVYPKWNVVNDDVTPGLKGPISNAKPPYPYWGGIWNRWFYADIPIDLVQAYDLIYDSGELEKIGYAQGVDAKKRLEDDVLRAAVEFVRTYKEYFSNMSPFIYQGLVISGRVLGEPDYVHDAIERITTLYKTGFFFDGLWKEGSTSYHYQTINSMTSCLRALKGYSDPPGYKWYKDGSHLEKVDLEKTSPAIVRSKVAPLLMVFPDGHQVPVHDTWASECNKTDYIQGSMLLSDYGHARLGCGSRDNLTHVYLHFSGGYGHQHADALSLILFAKGRELLSDIGYTHTAWRFWTQGTHSHNTVAVNGQKQSSSGHGGNLQLFSPIEGPVQAVEAIQTQSYPKVVDEFRRRLILVKISDTDAYVVDVFGVRGGKQHEFFLHGSSWYPQVAEMSLPLHAIPGTLLGSDVKFELPRSENNSGTVSNGKLLDYALFNNLREATTDQTFTITWKFTKDSPACLRSTILGQPACRVVLADTPQVRPAKEDDSKLPDFKRPSLVIQRKGEEGLTSTLVAVHEPFTEHPFLKNVKPLLPNKQKQPDNPVALAIEHYYGTDYIVSCNQLGGLLVDLRQQQGPRSKARLGIVRMVSGQIVFAYLYDGEELSLDNFSVKCASSPTGKIEAVNRDEYKNKYSFLVGNRLPAGDMLAGSTIIVTHPDKTTHGYIIKKVEAKGEKSLIHLKDDPGFDLVEGKTRFLFYPQHEIEGTNNYRVDNVVIVSRTDGGDYKIQANCAAKVFSLSKIIE